VGKVGTGEHAVSSGAGGRIDWLMDLWGHSRPRPKPSRMPHLRQRQPSTGGNDKWRGNELIGIKWDDKEWSELYTRAEMVQFSRHSDGELR
jgi:hypothetical protein